ncbi:LON peptidase N-terminal domain and ring finger 1, like [Polypterus senegalus]
MSFLKAGTEEQPAERTWDFYEGGEWDVATHVDPQQVLLSGDEPLVATAAQGRLKEALDSFAMALRYGSVGPEQLNTLLDCLLQNYLKTGLMASYTPDGELLDCPACHRFLADPVTWDCGHSHCKRCAQQSLLTKCSVCNEKVPSGCGKPNVVLVSVLERWFPREIQIARAIGEIEDQVKRRRFKEALALVNRHLVTDPEDTLLRIYRAEIYLMLQQCNAAFEEIEAVNLNFKWKEGCFRKGKILKDIGHTEQSLQLFLHCLALDEDFTPAKREIEQGLCGLLCPGPENVKEQLRETMLCSSSCFRSKVPYDFASEGRLSHKYCDADQLPEEQVLKRTSSAPHLSGSEKGTLLKRKLSTSAKEADYRKVYDDGHNKQKKKGTIVAATASSLNHKEVPHELIDVTDFECSLCMRLFYEPVTTPCGHTFCKSCLQRCLDHSPQCPLCKESLKEYLACRKYNMSHLIEKLLHKYFLMEHLERKRIHNEETMELSDLTKNVPVFVCTMAYPTVPCPLHVFEPRYRLMIRRCMETGTRQFGMCISDPQKGFADYGCILQIRSVHFLPDGRSVVDTIGGKRFKVLQRGMRDGYCVADIEYLEDIRVQNEEELHKLQELHDQVYMQACTWFQKLENRFRCQILQHFGPMPEREDDIQATPNGPACCWWLLAVLPVDPRYQLSVLSMMSLKERLIKIQHILTYLQSIPSEQSF